MNRKLNIFKQAIIVVLGVLLTTGVNANDSIWKAAAPDAKPVHVISISGPITPESMNTTISETLQVLVLTNKQIYIHINSEGGSYSFSMAYAGIVKNHRDRFICYPGQLVASAAFLILSQCEDIVESGPTAFMWHPVRVPYPLNDGIPGLLEGEVIQLTAFTDLLEFKDHPDYGIMQYLQQDIKLSQEITDIFVINGLEISKNKELYYMLRDSEAVFDWDTLRKLSDKL